MTQTLIVDCCHKVVYTYAVYIDCPGPYRYPKFQRSSSSGEKYFHPLWLKSFEVLKVLTWKYLIKIIHQHLARGCRKWESKAQMAKP